MEAQPLRKILLISNKVMHYRISVYNFFNHEFKKHGYEFVVRTNSFHAESKNPVGFDFSNIPFDFFRVINEIKLTRPCVVILFLQMKDVVLWPLIHWLKLMRIPVIYWTKGANLDDPDNALKNALFSYLHTLSDGLILYSENELGFVKPRNRRKVSVANNTLNFHDFPQMTESKLTLKKELGIPYRKIVLFAGRMGIDGDRKKVAHIIQVFKEIKDPSVGLVIVGSGMLAKDKDDIRAMSNVMYLGEVHDERQEKITKIFSIADLFCIPGHIGLGINQALLFGLPAVTEEGGQPPEIQYLINGRNGFIVPHNDIGALGEKVLLLLENDTLREEFSKNARSDIMLHASVEKMFDGFLEAVQRVDKKNNGSVS